MNKTTLILIAIFCLNISGICQTEKYYHKFRGTDSFIKITDWQVGFENKGDSYIIETVDSQNRVIELRFIFYGYLFGSNCYDSSIIKFEYKGDSIIQYNMVNDSTYSSDIECGL